MKTSYLSFRILTCSRYSTFPKQGFNLINFPLRYFCKSIFTSGKKRRVFERIKVELILSKILFFPIAIKQLLKVFNQLCLTRQPTTNPVTPATIKCCTNATVQYFLFAELGKKLCNFFFCLGKQHITIIFKIFTALICNLLSATFQLPSFLRLVLPSQNQNCSCRITLAVNQNIFV